MNDRVVIYKFKKYKEVKTLYEYAILFDNSNNMIDFVCEINAQNIISSKLYTKSGTYQLIITSNQKHNKKLKYTVFHDKFHIDEIKLHSHLICENSAVSQIQSAFKEI